jgi:Tol biopolymer transport system component
MRTSRALTVTVFSLLFLSLAAGAASALGSSGTTGAAGAPSGVGASPPSAPVTSPYGSPRPILTPEIFEPGRISTGDDESHPAFWPDGRELYFLRNTPDFRHWTILVSRFEGGRWSEPEVAPFSGRYSDADPSFSPDGQTFFFISTRPLDGKGPEREDTEIWLRRKTAQGWSEPEPIAALSSETDEWLPTVTASGTLYFGSSRPGGKGGTDVWRSRCLDGEYTAPENLGEPVNTSGNETEPFVAPDESYLILAAGRPEGRGSYDLYVSYHCGGKWTNPVPLGAEVNSTAWDFAPRVTPDGRYLYFSSNRSAFEKPLERRLGTKELMERLRSPGNGLRDVYRVEVEALGLKRPCL